MTYATHPDQLYDSLLTDATYPTRNGVTLPIRDSTIDKIAAKEGSTKIDIDRPDGTTHTLTGDTPIPNRDTLVDQLFTAQTEFNNEPVRTLNNQNGARLGPLHFTDTTAHFVTSTDIFTATPERGVGALPDEFQTLPVQAAHLVEGYTLADDLPYHWRTDLGWEIERHEAMHAARGSDTIPDDRAPDPDNCLIINVPTAFPAQSFGAASNAPAETVIHTIAYTEQLLEDTLLTERMAQLEALETYYETLFLETKTGTRGLSLTPDDLAPLDEVAQQTFHITDSGLASLRSQRNTRKDKAFETVRRLADDENFNHVMEEFAETIPELGHLAHLGTKYRREVQNKPPGFY